MNLLVPRIHINKNVITYEFWLNTKPVLAEKALDLFEYASQINKEFWAFRVKEGKAIVYVPPKIYTAIIDQHVIRFDDLPIKQFLSWLPPCVASSFVARSESIFLERDGIAISLNAIVHETLRV